VDQQEPVSGRALEFLRAATATGSSIYDALFASPVTNHQVRATSFSGNIAENFFKNPLISFAFCHTQLAY
jgi:hypothetical protein